MWGMETFFGGEVLKDKMKRRYMLVKDRFFIFILSSFSLSLSLIRNVVRGRDRMGGEGEDGGRKYILKVSVMGFPAGDILRTYYVYTQDTVKGF